ncbi:MAG: ABC transporter ATP-binding protein [Thermoanaerobaculia bacterium]|nr:ABC transporter ATP-binding protein [Thermoanaerobaculia bacterium]
MIETTQLHKRFGQKVAVESLDLDLATGEFFCFLGPNGAGKTTTIKMLTGLIRPTSGRARVGGVDVQQDPVAAKRLLGYVPDHPFLYDKLTGREMLRFVAGLYRMDVAEFHRRVDSMLETFELAQVADQLVEHYSHGMRQKLSFACCFLHQPKVVVVDEPWVGLDPKNIRAVKQFLRQRADEDGLTIFMSTHTLSIAEEVADRIGIIHRGRLLHVGTVEEIKALARRRQEHQLGGSLEDVFLELTRDEEAYGP